MARKKQSYNLNRPLRVHTYSGIGDISWVYSKLVTLNRPLDIVYYTIPEMANQPLGSRCVPLLQMLPGVRSYRISTLQTRMLRAHNPVDRDEIDACDEIYCAANTHLEIGRRIEEFLPGVDTNHHYPLNIPEEDRRYARHLTKNIPDYCLLYISSIGGNAHWGGWGADQWAALIYQYRMLIDNKPVLLIGAEWDHDLAKLLHLPNMINLVGQTTLGTTLELIKLSRHFIAFPSGLAIMACQLKHPVLMFYPRSLRCLHYSWPPPAMIADHSYIATQWGNPEDIMKRVATYWDKTGVIFRKINVTTSCRPITIS